MLGARAPVCPSCAPSDGVRLGRNQFDSGGARYVYRIASGSAVRRIIDRNYLDASADRHPAAWLTSRSCCAAIADRRAADAPVRIVDVAAGHSRYVLDAIAAGDAQPDSIVLRDYGERNVRGAAHHARARGPSRRSSKATFHRADWRRCTAADDTVASGLYSCSPKRDGARFARRPRRSPPARWSPDLTPVSLGTRLELIARPHDHAAGPG
jgi:hypothetical protein